LARLCSTTELFPLEWALLYAVRKMSQSLFQLFLKLF